MTGSDELFVELYHIFQCSRFTYHSSRFKHYSFIYSSTYTHLHILIFVFIHLFIQLSIHPSIHPSIYPSIYPSIHQSIPPDSLLMSDRNSSTGSSVVFSCFFRWSVHVSNLTFKLDACCLISLRFCKESSMILRRAEIPML